MIIEYTFKDNDYTQIIEKYLSEYGPFTAILFSSIDEYMEFRQDIMKCDELTQHITSKVPEIEELKEKLKDIFKQTFINYINGIKPNSAWNTGGISAKELNASKDYITNNIHVKIVDSISDKWQNGEVVYFITSNEKYLVM